MSETYPGQMLPELQEKTTVDSNDLFYMVSSNASKKIKGSNLKDQMKPSDYTGATSSTNGANGLVPQPTTSDVDRFLKGDGTWGDISYAVGEASGSIASFSDGSPLPMRSLKAYIEPVQSGSGEPSPSNIRPISGWTACNVGDHGKNYAPSSGYTRGLLGWNRNNIDEVGSSNTWITSPLITIKPNTTYTVSCTKGNISRFYVGDIAHNALSYTGSKAEGDTFQVTTGATAKYMRFSIGFDGTTVTTSDYGTLVYCQIEEGNQATTYEPYNGQTYTIDLDGTRYGGTLDVVSGVLTVDRVNLKLGDLTWTYESSWGQGADFYSNVINGAKVPPNNQTVANALCSHYSVVSRDSIYNSSNSALSLIPSGIIKVRDDNYSDAAAFKTAMANVDFTYELATPQFYQLTAQQVKSLLGVNNVWADTGDVDVHYVRDLTITIDDILSRLEALEG